VEKESKKALTKRQFAEALNISEALVSKWIRTGKVRKLKLGRCTRIPIEELTRVAAGGVA